MRSASCMCEVATLWIFQCFMQYSSYSIGYLRICLNSQKLVVYGEDKNMMSKGVFMRLVRLRAPGGLENLKLIEEDPPKPRPGEVLVRIRASSLNFHDDMVVLGKIPCDDGRIPMTDG